MHNLSGRLLLARVVVLKDHSWVFSPSQAVHATHVSENDAVACSLVSTTLPTNKTGIAIDFCRSPGTGIWSHPQFYNHCKSRIFRMHDIFVYFVHGGFRTKINCMRKVHSKSENPQRSVTVRNFHACEQSESPGYENWVRTKYSGFTVLLYFENQQDLEQPSSSSICTAPAVVLVLADSCMILGWERNFPQMDLKMYLG